MPKITFYCVDIPLHGKKIQIYVSVDVKEIVKKATPFILYFGTLRQTGKLSIYLNTVRSFQTAYSF